MGRRGERAEHVNCEDRTAQVDRAHIGGVGGVAGADRVVNVLLAAAQHAQRPLRWSRVAWSRISTPSRWSISCWITRASSPDASIVMGSPCSS